MKKVFLSILCLLPILCFAGCVKTDPKTLVKANMSEKSDVYFFSAHDEYLVSIASGQREEPYSYDAKSQKKCDFALVIASLNSSENELVKISINGEQEDLVMEYNIKTGTHMADLERRLTGDEEISFSYMDKSVKLECKSKTFNVSSEKAIEIGMEHLSDFILPLCNGKNFNGECYLKILDNVSGGFNDVFWLFSVLGKGGEMKNVVISTKEAVVLATGKENMI